MEELYSPSSFTFVFQEEARAALQWCRGEHFDITEEFDEIVKKKEEESKTKTSNFNEKIQTIFSLTFLKCFCCSGVLFFLCQFTGITSLVVFMTNVFEVRCYFSDGIYSLC